MDNEFSYFVSEGNGYLSLARLGPVFSAELFAYPGVWKDMPHLNDIRVGKGCFMDYDPVSEEEALEIMKAKKEEYGKMTKE